MESVRGWLVPVGAAVLIVSLVAVALVREPAQLDPNTPEGTVQVYLQALSDGDYEGAFAVLDPEFYEGCDRRLVGHLPSGRIHRPNRRP